MKYLGAFVAVVALGLVACGGGGDPGTCTITFSGATSGTGPCKSFPKALGLNSASALQWRADLQSDTHDGYLSIQVPNPPSATTYVGDAGNDSFCVANITLKGAKAWTASSKPNSSGIVQGSCSVTFTSLSGETAGSTATYTAHGTATATLWGTGAADAVQLDVTY